MKQVELYTDGACSVNPGKGGWAAVLFFKGIRKELSGFEAETTNNRMELLAVIQGLSALKEPCYVNLYSDSAYVINAFQNNWITGWRMRGWRTAGNKEVKNIDLWERLCALTSHHTVKWIKVKGHSDNEHNNRCDELARAEILKNSNNI